MMQRTIRSLAGGLSLAVLAACGRAPEAAEMSPEPTPAIGAVDDAALLERGRYLTVTSGCNDCHSPGYAESGGTTPEAEWLVGSPLGWSGPWGTTYPANLRLKAAEMDEAAWLDYTATLHTRPPMPDFAVRAMTPDDRRALYRFIRSLGPGGEAAPAYLPPGEQPPLPFVQWHLPAPPPGTPAAG